MSRRGFARPEAQAGGAMKKVELQPDTLTAFIAERGGVLSIAEQVYLVG